MKFLDLLNAALEEIAKSEPMEGVEKTTQSAVAVMPVQFIQPQQIQFQQNTIHTAFDTSMARVLSTLDVPPIPVASARPVKTADESKALINEICVAVKERHLGQKYGLLKDFICGSYNLDALQAAFKKENITLGSFPEWITNILQLVLNTPDLTTPANLKAIFQAMKIFYHAGAKFRAENLDLIKKKKWLDIFKEVFDLEVPLICLRLGYDELLSISEIKRQIHRSGSTYSLLLSRALLSFDGKVSLRRFEMLLDSGVNVATILESVNELFVNKTFNKNHLFSLKTLFSLKQRLPFVALENEIENVLVNLIMQGPTENMELAYCFRMILSSDLRGIPSEVRKCDPALQSTTSATKSDDTCVLNLALDLYKSRLASAGMFFQEIEGSLKQYSGAYGKLKKLDEFFKPEKLGKFAEHRIFRGIRGAIDNAMIHHPDAAKAKRKMETPETSAAKSVSFERGSQLQAGDKVKKARSTTENDSVKENVLRMQ